MFGFRKKSEESIQDYWNARYIRDASDYEEIYTSEIIWKYWDRNFRPESSAETRLLDAIEVLSGSDNVELAERFTKRCLEIIDRINQEDKLAALTIDYPRNRGCLYRTQVYAQTLIGGSWNNKLLNVASHDYEEHCRSNYPDKQDWDSQIQYYYINAIHLALFSGDIARADNLMEKPPYPLKSHAEHVSLLQGVIRFYNDELTIDEQTEFIAAYDVFFNRIRDPRLKKPNDYFMETIGPIEISLIREMYIRHPSKTINWNNVIEEYSK